jgi:hypothetical protein
VRNFGRSKFLFKLGWLWCAVLVPTKWAKFVFWIYLLFLVWTAGTATNPADPDLWHRLAVGEFLAHTGHFPPGDAFSYLADYQSVADHEWGGAVIFYALWQAGGGSAIVAMKLVTLAVTLALVVWAGMDNPRRPTALMAGFYALVLLAMLPSFQSTVRCMIFTHMIFALWVYWFQAERHGRVGRTWPYVVTMMVWANLHGGFAVGFFWLAVVGAIEFFEGGNWRKWALRFGLCAGATLVNPFGWQLWISTGRALVATRRGFDEWAPVSWFSSPLNYPGYKVLVFVVLVILATQLGRRGWRRIDRAAVILVMIFMGLAMTSARHTSLFAVVAGALVPSLIPMRWPNAVRFRPLRRLAAIGINAAIMVVPIFTCLLVLPGAGMELEFPHAACPVDAVAYLQSEGVRGNLLVPFNYGSYALWELRGKMRVSMDGRYDLVYKPETYRRVDDFFGGKGDLQGLLASPKPDAILVPMDDGVYSKLGAEPGWREAWHDSVDAVFLPR